MATEIEVVEGFGLSPQQKHLWGLQQVNRSQPYRAQCEILMEGALNFEVLQTALARTVQRHEIFRTTFQTLPGITDTVQVVREGDCSVPQVLDLSACDVREQGAGIEALFDEMGARPFNFAQGPLIDLALLRLKADKHLLLVSLPAMCADSVTLTNLMQEIGLSYEACLGGREVAETMQYADVSEWQNEMLEAEYAAVGVEFWRKQARTLAQMPRLPFEVYQPDTAEFAPRRLASTLDADLVAKLEGLVTKYSASADKILSTCWQILLWRITGQETLVTGVAYDGRDYQELGRALGPLSKYIPVQSRLDEQTRFSEALKHTVAAYGDAAQWQGCFSWKLISETDRDGTAAFSHLAFEFEGPPPRCSAAGVSFSMNRKYVCADRFKLKLFCLRKGDSLVTEFHYDANLIPAEHVELLARQFHALLNNAVNNTEAAIGQLEILAEPERRHMPASLKETKTAPPPDKCIHELFEEQVRRRPEKIALVFEEQRLTYAELNARANQLAHYLRARGVGPEARVGICVERSIEMVMGMLAVLKAGGAYVPLDPALPRERMAAMVEDARIEVLLTQEDLSGALPDSAARVIRLDSEWANAIARESAENPGGAPKAGNLVYVLFTSGSTGNPKGVGIEHRQLVNYLQSITGELEVGPQANFALVSTFAADLGNTVIFPALCNGGCLHVISQERMMDAAAIADYFRRHHIDCVKIVPAHLAGLMASSRPEQVLPRQQLVLGGEASKWELIDKLQRLSPDCSILNHYGPTETTVGVLTYKVEKEPRPRFSATVPLGRPLSNTQVYLLDGGFKPVPAWAVGELYIGGGGVGRGYLNQPALTAERFVPDPFGDEPGTRLYRTGDLARRLHDGCIEFLGRNDHQVKVRGFRVELGEIETALNRHPSVREAVVVMHEGGPNKKHLVAYIAPLQAQSPVIKELQSHLKQTLPAHMIPTTFVMLKSIPLTPNGKIDRRALPSPDDSRGEDVEYVAPRDELENIFVSIWQKVLDVTRVGLHDDYFALGGDSIRVIQIVYEANRANLAMHAVDLFQNPTVSSLARHVRQGKTNGRAAQPVPIELADVPAAVRHSLPPDVEDVYPASKMQQFIIEHYAHDRQKMGVYHIQHAYHIYDEGMSVKAFKSALELLVQAHTTLRTTFVFGHTDEPLQIVNKELPLTIEEVNLTGLTANEQQQHIETALQEDRENLFDVEKAGEPLIRFAIFIRSENSIEFLMSMHHALSDGWGNRELAKEVVGRYASLKQGAFVDNVKPGSEYKEFIALEREIIASKEARDFWRRHLINHTHRPPQRRAQAASDGSSPDNYVGTLETELAAALYERSRDLRVSIKAVLLGAYLDLIGAQTNQGRVTVGVVSNGRSERLSNPFKAMGLFWNIIPFCGPANAVDKTAHLKTVQQLLIEAELFARYPLPQILHDAQTTELFSATFNFLHFHNVRDLASRSSLRLLGLSGHDKFHFPLNFVLSVDPFNAEIGYRVEYDKSYFGGESVARMIDNYIHRLTTQSVS